MVGDDVTVARLKLLAEYTSDLQELQSVTREEYRQNKLIRQAVERTLHTAIEACLDIGHHPIATRRFRSPVDNTDVFAVLSEESIISPDLATRLMKMARFRSFLVHEYTRLDNDIVYGVSPARRPTSTTSPGPSRPSLARTR